MATRPQRTSGNMAPFEMRMRSTENIFDDGSFVSFGFVGLDISAAERSDVVQHHTMMSPAPNLSTRLAPVSALHQKAKIQGDSRVSWGFYKRPR